MATKKEASSQQKYKAPALEKGLEILEVLANRTSGLSLTDLAKQLDRSKSELFRPLATLEARGYINRDENTAVYSLSLRLYELAHKHPPVVNLLEAAHHPMEMLANKLNESCHLSVLRKGRLVVLKEVLSSARVRLSVPVGGRFSPFTTVSGRLLVANMVESERKDFLATNHEFSNMSQDDQESMRQDFVAIRKTGLSTANSETYPGVFDTAVLIGNPEINVTAAIAVASLKVGKEPLQRQEIIDMLQTAAQQITHTLGLNHDSNNLL
ncbi:MAG: IclR family transcriptional regulator [Chloroflexi bacterium]|nr:IclR family transcriptional regulator [Chloroflexota bacterium]